MAKKCLMLLMLLLFAGFASCETETDCYNDGNAGQTCIERPIPGTCIDNNFGF